MASIVRLSLRIAEIESLKKALSPGVRVDRLASARRARRDKGVVENMHEEAPSERGSREEVLKSMTSKEIRQMSSLIARLHRNLGHPQKTTLLRAMRLAGCSAKSLAVAYGFHCDECQELSRTQNSSQKYLVGITVLLLPLKLTLIC